MLKESLKSKFSEKVNKSVTASLNVFNLLTLIEKMNHKPIMFNGDLHSMVLLNQPDKQIVLTTFDKGTEINSFQSKELMVLQVFWGKLRFHTHEKSLTLSRGELFTLDEKEPYILTTSERTVFLLTLISGNMSQTNINFTDKKQKYNG
jgi:quercetin dioxygenase-like cupin family protein